MNTDKIYAEKLASEYAPKKKTKVNALRKLDNKAKLPSKIFAYTWGTAWALVLGLGMCLAMGVLASGSSWALPLGIIIGIVGILGVSLTYPIHNAILKRSKEKYADDIIELAKDIAEGN